MARWERRQPDEARGGAERDRASAPTPSVDARLSELTSAVGNVAFSAFARDGAGLLPGGRVHPDVEQAIARTRGTGTPIDRGVRDRAASVLGDPLDDVRVHTDARADAMARSVSARAFTTGTDVYFGRGEYRPGTNTGDELIGHELTHVVQQRGASTSGPLTVTEPGDALEAEADAAGRELP
ncbi:MAG TPA: DUF4157 domain-containing protein [Solirubrobacteraceae bacterium]|nr:DUF4157 domain-containing protein [Solirubrobacteraceae bacterium]